MTYFTITDLASGAAIERKLRTIPPGKAMNISCTELADAVIPPMLDPNNRVDVEGKARYFKSVMPFYCELFKPIDGDYYRYWRRET